MLYHLFSVWVNDLGFLNVGRYITFRALVSLLMAMLCCVLVAPWLIRRLRLSQLGQVVREEGPASHLSKAGTPTMGGLLILMAVLLPSLLWVSWNNHLFWAALLIFLGYGALGWVDDYLKIKHKNSAGVPGRVKLVWQVLLAIIACLIHDGDTNIGLPFVKGFSFDLGYLYLPFCVFIIVGSSNAVNLTDGLDGLATGAVVIAATCFAVLTYVSGHAHIAQYLGFPYIEGSGELAIFACCLVGAGLGFLWYNSYPAQIFMGDVGSLPLGGVLGALAVFSKHEILLAVIGGLFVVEALSVMIQVFSFKVYGKRVFRMAPIHHHFELKGWPEPKVVVRFWLMALILAMVGLLSLKVR